MKAITEKQPWGSLIVHGIKDIENRTWKTKFRGRVLIHAGQIPVKFDGLADILTKNQFDSLNGNIEPFMGNHCGYIIGSVEIVDCVINHASIWAEKSMENKCPICRKKISKLNVDLHWCNDCGRKVIKGIHYEKPTYNWVLANPILFDKPIPAKGKLSFWESGVEVCHICGQPADLICAVCGEYFCQKHTVHYNQFTQIDYDCCTKCEQTDPE